MSSEEEGRIREASMWSNPDSYVGSRSTSISERFQINNLLTIKSLNKHAYKTQKQCSVCEKQVAKHGIISARKYCCKFCYNAVCEDCSPLTFLHPESNRPERVCISCYYNFIEEKLKTANNQELKYRLEDEIQDKGMETAKRIVAELRYKEIESEIKAKDESIESLRIEKQNLLSSKNQRASRNYENIGSYQDQLQLLRTENDELKKRSENIISYQASQRSGACCSIQ